MCDIQVDHTDVVAKNETGASSVVVVAPPVATTGEEDGDEDAATINKWPKMIRVTALKFNEYITYVEYIVLLIIFIGSIALVREREYINIKFVIQS